MSKKVAMLSMDDPDFPEKFLEAIGCAPGEPVHVITPQFERTDGKVPALVAAETFPLLTQISPEQRIELGMGVWDEPDETGRCLWLFPGDWFEFVPEGFVVESISGDISPWVRNKADDDTRFGMLAYGVRAQSLASTKAPTND